MAVGPKGANGLARNGSSAASVGTEKDSDERQRALSASGYEAGRQSAPRQLPRLELPGRAARRQLVGCTNKPVEIGSSKLQQNG
jgi:hypothetical protein